MAGRKPLVTQHLENVSREALERYQTVLRGYIRRRQGLYALYRKSRLYYVGLAGNLRARLDTHLRDRHGESWDRFSVYLTIGDEHMRELEALILRIVNPAGNKVKGQFVKSENLKNKVKRDLRRLQREEAALLFGGRPKQEDDEAPRPRGSKRAAGKGRRAALARYIQAPMPIRVRYKGKTHRARVRRDGTILHKGKTFTSPSLAGAKVVGHSCNGWKFWKYQRSPGDWVLLENLRR
ncbi:MAG: DUF4357 domain-containing protein [Deltaproteobacteria bacterium]|nr:DUF4357 domain-containing protein [Deltaproteobacteria bacterium]